jgi:hypothetical protein
MGKLIWERTNEDSKDLHLVNPEALDKAEYLRVLKKFGGIAGTKLGGRLEENLAEVGKSPEHAVLTFRGDRLGYDGLNRWCTTDGSRFTDDEVFAASKVWKILFDQTYPPTLVKPAGRTGLNIVEHAWNSWYEKVSKT